MAAELPLARLAGSADAGRLAAKACVAAELPHFCCFFDFSLFSGVAGEVLRAAVAEPTASKAALLAPVDAVGAAGVVASLTAGDAASLARAAAVDADAALSGRHGS